MAPQVIDYDQGLLNRVVRRQIAPVNYDHGQLQYIPNDTKSVKYKSIKYDR
ncbi:hypothetical protein MA16_Dca024239 [Dendrobium catenatum]|uniref:Uncharacterized protein n=1 Tax=Dendrobium catenatum TaxID=906689 RepID=A0A2I0VHC4_9ASPA|nr:hypothetical protein MA16_Dca024239 [Dendrobium catenatum]